MPTEWSPVLSSDKLTIPPTEWSPVLSSDPSPSFNTYSSATLAQIADRVVHELSIDTDLNNHTFKFNNKHLQNRKSENTYVKDEFEFKCTFRDSSLIAADDVFCNGQIRPVFPLFNSDLSSPNMKPPRPVRQSLRKLFIKERETASCSSSDADELDGIQPEIYCVWKPRVSESRRCKKSNSFGSSKRWKISDLLKRSDSDGKVAVEKWKKDDTVKVKEAGAGDLTAMEGNRRWSYKEGVVGLFGNVRGMSRNIHPF